MGFNAEAYWADKPVKKFSIVLRTDDLNAEFQRLQMNYQQEIGSLRDAAFKRAAISLQREDDTTLSRWQSLIAWLAGDLPK